MSLNVLLQLPHILPSATCTSDVILSRMIRRALGCMVQNVGEESEGDAAGRKSTSSTPSEIVELLSIAEFSTASSETPFDTAAVIDSLRSVGLPHFKGDSLLNSAILASSTVSPKFEYLSSMQSDSS